MENDSGWLQMENVREGSELQVENNSGWLQTKNDGGPPRKTAVVSFRWNTSALGYSQRRVVVGFKWITLLVSGLLQLNVYSGWLQMINGGGFPRRTTVVRFTTALGYRRRTTVVGKER